MSDLQNKDEKRRSLPAPRDGRSGEDTAASTDATQKDSVYSQETLKIPKIELPKGGGALKSIDEKFQVNSANGTLSLTVPLPLSKPRSDFAPALSLSYNSGGGNGVFGLGWRGAKQS